MSLKAILALLLLRSAYFPLLVNSSNVEGQCSKEEIDENDGNDKSCSSRETEPSIESLPQLPEDFVDPCQDENPSCPVWAREGECRANPNYMLASCARSCGSCLSVESLAGAEDGGDGSFAGGGAATGVAANKIEEEPDMKGLCEDREERCPDWAQAGECTINPIYMRKSCKYSCWQCVDAQKDRQLGVPEDIIAKKLVYLTMDIGKSQLLRKPTNDKQTEQNSSDQAVVISRKQYKLVKSIIQKMEHYAQYQLTKPSISIKTRERCRNEFRMCAEWAAKGMCLPNSTPTQSNDIMNDGGASGDAVDTTVFMMNMCPLACQTCEQIEHFHRCAGKRHAFAEPVMEGIDGVASFWEDKRQYLESDGNVGIWDQYSPLFVSYPQKGKENDPYMVLFQNFLSNDEADHLISLGSSLGWNYTDTENDDTSDVTKMSFTSCHNRNECTEDDTYLTILRRISALVNGTTDNESSDSHVSSIMDYIEPMEFLHFKEGEYTTLHHNYQRDSMWRPAGPRILSFFLFLSDVTEGGELGFRHMDWLFIRPQKGMAVVWPNVQSQNVWKMDKRMDLEHFIVEKGNKYGVKVHVRLYNWTDANLRGCA